MIKHWEVITEAAPHTFHGGGGVTPYSAVRAMLNENIRVSIIALISSEFIGSRSYTQIRFIQL